MISAANIRIMSDVPNILNVWHMGIEVVLEIFSG